jgi:hypothetical protein
MASTPATTTAILQFIGIVLFTRELSDDNHLQAIMPRITASAAHEHAAAPPTKKAESVPADVEAHTAFIAFPHASYLDNKGWAPSALAVIPGYDYVRLDGEQIEFVSEKKIAPKRKGPNLTQQSQPAEELGLPHLKKCCSAMSTLKKQFQGPDFSGAAAVFDVRTGKASGCRASAAAPRGRVDTQLTLENDGSVTIRARKGKVTKEIRLRGDAQVYVANLPMSSLQVRNSRSPSAPHYEAYYAMADGGTRCENFQCALDATMPACKAKLPARLQPGMGIKPKSGPDSIDYECSNSQWP